MKNSEFIAYVFALLGTLALVMFLTGCDAVDQASSIKSTPCSIVTGKI